MNNGLLKQSNFLGKWWGNLQMIAQHANIYIQGCIFAFSAIAAYGAISQVLADWGIRLMLWQFIAFILTGLVLISLFVWKLTIPSTFATWNCQWWEHDNPLRPRIEQMERNQKKIMEKLGIDED